jgi:hypothetical protein
MEKNHMVKTHLHRVVLVYADTTPRRADTTQTATLAIMSRKTSDGGLSEGFPLQGQQPGRRS